MKRSRLADTGEVHGALRTSGGRDGVECADDEEHATTGVSAIAVAADEGAAEPLFIDRGPATPDRIQSPNRNHTAHTKGLTTSDR